MLTTPRAAIPQAIPQAVIVNGELFTGDSLSNHAASAKISVFDRSFIYGDSLYEVARTYDGQPFAMAEHLERLKKSGDLCQMTYSHDLSFYGAEMRRAIDAFRKLPGQETTEAYCRIILTRGVGKIGFGRDCVQSPTQYVIIAQPLNPPTAEQYEKGYRYRVVDRLRNHPQALAPAMKSGNYLNNLLAYLEATDEGFDDALLCNGQGHVTEGTTFNIFYIKNGIICTAPLNVGILEGITRAITLQVASRLGFPVREVRFPKERFYEADEVFMSSTIREVFPVTQIDGHRIGQGKLKGKPGPITRQLSQAFREEVARRLSLAKSLA